MPLDMNTLRKAGVSRKLASLLLASAGSSGGSGGGSGATASVARLVCTDFHATEVTTGNGSGAPYTRYVPTLWTLGPAPQPSSLPVPGVHTVPSSQSGTNFDVTESGLYTLRYSVIATFGDDAGCPPWVTFSAGSYWQNRPASGVVRTTTGALTAIFPGSGAPGAIFDVVMPAFYQTAFDPDDGSCYLGIQFGWPGVGKTPSQWSIMADLARVG
jgi:hypothetical protein